jgi:hypothetical protein
MSIYRFILAAISLLISASALAQNWTNHGQRYSEHPHRVERVLITEVSSNISSDRTPSPSPLTQWRIDRAGH